MEKRETIPGNETTQYEYTTTKLAGRVQTVLYEWNRAADGTWYWLIFGGWRMTLCVGGPRATAKAVSTQHEAHRQAALDAIAARMAAS